MCRIGAIKSKAPVHPSQALRLMMPQQEGHDNSGFAMVMQDLGGLFAPYPDLPLLSLACTQKGTQLVEDYMEARNFHRVFEWVPKPKRRTGQDIKAMPHYIFRCYDYPEQYAKAAWEEKQELLLDARLELRSLLEQQQAGYVYSFWPNVLTLKEIGKPHDIADYFRLWEDNGELQAKNIVVQCRQNTNYEVVRYAAHPFFLQGYTLCANGENTFFTRNRDFQRSLHRGYIGFESDSQNFLYTLHYVLHVLKWPVQYYKHVITPLPAAEMEGRKDGDALRLIRQSLAHLEINGPNTVIAMLPDGSLLSCCDGKKLRPVVIGGDAATKVITSEVCGLNAVLPRRKTEEDVYPHEREVVIITPDLEVQRWLQ
ncbi:MAG TPA: glutamate synthase [Selenomonadales bacterium]|nr:glutamate synthase [Selenomonadales bacterium]